MNVNTNKFNIFIFILMLCLVWGFCFIILKDNETEEITQTNKKETTHELCIITQPPKVTTRIITNTAPITTSSNVTMTSLNETDTTCLLISETTTQPVECATECAEIAEEIPTADLVCNTETVEIENMNVDYSACSISEDDVTLIASVVETEWNSTFDGKVLVAIVILNRIN